MICAPSARCAEWLVLRGAASKIRRRSYHGSARVSSLSWQHEQCGVNSALAARGPPRPPPLWFTSDTGIQLAGEQIRGWCNNEHTVRWFEWVVHSNQLITPPNIRPHGGWGSMSQPTAFTGVPLGPGGCEKGHFLAGCEMRNHCAMMVRMDFFIRIN